MQGPASRAQRRHGPAAFDLSGEAAADQLRRCNRGSRHHLPHADPAARRRGQRGRGAGGRRRHVYRARASAAASRARCAALRAAATPPTSRQLRRLADAANAQCVAFNSGRALLDLAVEGAAPGAAECRRTLLSSAVSWLALAAEALLLASSMPSAGGQHACAHVWQCHGCTFVHTVVRAERHRRRYTCREGWARCPLLGAHAECHATPCRAVPCCAVPCQACLLTLPTSLLHACPARLPCSIPHSDTSLERGPLGGGPSAGRPPGGGHPGGGADGGAGGRAAGAEKHVRRAGARAAAAARKVPIGSTATATRRTRGCCPGAARASLWRRRTCCAACPSFWITSASQCAAACCSGPAAPARRRRCSTLRAGGAASGAPAGAEAGPAAAVAALGGGGAAAACHGGSPGGSSACEQAAGCRWAVVAAAGRHGRLPCVLL